MNMKNNSTPKVVAMYRVKNEERWIKKSIESIYNICSEIVVFDDASTDKTLEICSGFDKVVEIHQQSNDSFDEARDRTILLQMALKRKPTIILSLDGDEIFAPNSENIIQDELDIIYPNKQVFEFEILTLWDKPDQIRYDGVFGNFWHKRMFRLTDKPVNLEISNSPYPGNLHCGSIPSSLSGFDFPVKSSAKIFHCASLDNNVRQRKYNWYRTMDPDNNMTDNYKHMIGPDGKFSGKHGYYFKKIPNELTYDLS